MLLLLALGPRFGASTDFAGPELNPFDVRAARLARAFVDRELLASDPAARLVYPGQTLAIDLRGCLTAAGAQHTSRLGIGIRPDCGTWFAVRAAIATKLRATDEETVRRLYPPLTTSEGSPCTTCADSPCQKACPAHAVRTTVDLDTCIEQRLRPGSSCEALCHAREACPVGREFMYPREQVTYHYHVSLGMLRRWSATRE